MRASFVGAIARHLPRAQHRLRVLRLRFLDRKLRAIYDAYRGEFPTTLHGFPVILNGGNPYPFLVHAIPTFNRPLVELVRQTARALGRPALVIDVGASLGNTVLLLEAEASAAVGGIHCVEADPQFLRLLRLNTAQFPRTVIHTAMLARTPRRVPSLVRHHQGTAAATGAEMVDATTIDRLLLPVAPRFDVLKIDIDGFDGEALAGATELLRRDQPAVIFEWHPALLRATGNDARTPFDSLQASGYRRFLWFRNDGPFSHFSSPGNPEIAFWRDYLIALQPFGDPHFDIVALPPNLEHLAASLASFGQLPPGQLPTA